MVGLAPLVLGGNRPVLWSLNAAGAGLALGLTGLAMATRHGRQIDLALHAITPALLAGLVLVAWIFVQLIPWGDGSMGHPAWGLAAEAVGEPVAARITTDPTATWMALLRLLTAMALFIAVYALARQRENAGLLLGILIGFFCFYAAYGLFRLSFSLDRILWFAVSDTGFVTGTFISRNNAATYFGLGVVALTAVLARALGRTVTAAAALEGTARREAMVCALAGRLGGLAVLWLLLLTALILTGSRGGILASLVATAVLLVLRPLRGRGEGGLVVTRLAVTIGIFIGLVAVLEMAGAKLLSRILVSGFEDLNREHAARATLAAAFDHLWTGAGAGAFQSVFPLYRPAPLVGSGFWNRAHNDYLEALLGLGIPGFSAMMLMLGSLAWQALRGVFVRRRDSHFPLIGVAASVLVGLHAVVDFSLQIQGVALTYTALLGLGVAQSRSTRSG